jgi:hypothetical protein
MARIMPLIWTFLQFRRPATDWHDGQFAHDAHAQSCIGLSGKSVIAAKATCRSAHQHGCERAIAAEPAD